MKVLLIVFLLFTQLAWAQPQMVVDKPWTAASYIGFSKDINDLIELPRPIVDSAYAVLKKYMGDELVQRLTFTGAQIIDTSKYLKVEKKMQIPANLPKYEMTFSLKVPELGIEYLTVELRLSQGGKPLKITWPRKEVRDASVFLPRETVRNFALKKARELKFQTENYNVEFDYDEERQKFLWVFKFPNGPVDKDGQGNYHELSVNWLDLNDFKAEDIFIGVTY